MYVVDVAEEERDVLVELVLKYALLIGVIVELEDVVLVVMVVVLV